MPKIPNPKLMELLRNQVKVLSVKSAHSWLSLESDRRFTTEKEMEYLILQRAAREVGQKFADQLLESKRFEAAFERDNILDGLVCRLSVVPLTSDQLIDLIHQAYDLGRTETVGVIAPFRRQN